MKFFHPLRTSRRHIGASAMSLSLAALILTASGASANYKQKAEEQTDFIQAHFYDAKAKRYHPKFPRAPKELPYDFMWGNGVQFSALVGATRNDPDKYKAMLYDFREGLQTYWDPEAPIPGFNAYCSGPRGTDKYYDDNEWLVLGFTEAYETTKDRLFLNDARRTQKFVLSGWDDVLGGGIYWKLDHKSKNTCSNAPAAAAAMRLFQVDQENDQVTWATRIREWTNAHLQDKDGLYWDNINLNKEIGKHKFTYNSALMIRADILLAQLNNEPKSLAEARRIADAGLAEWTDPKTGSLHKTEDSALFTHLFCEALLRLYDATHDIKYLNAVRAEASYACHFVRDPSGGYYNKWTKTGHQPGEQKSLIESASDARLFWLLAPYQDVDDLTKSAAAAMKQGNLELAGDLLRQAVASDPANVEARHKLARLERSRRSVTRLIEPFSPICVI